MPIAKGHCIYFEKQSIREQNDMLNYIWGSMILIGIVYGSLTGHMAEVTNAALDSSREAVNLCITMIGVMAFWMGLMEIAEKAGLIDKWTKAISPFVSFMFPHIPKGHMARNYISTKMIANVLGLGGACTPAGLKAMEELAKLEEERGNPGYLSADRVAGSHSKERAVGYGRGSIADGLECTGEKKGKRERVASNEMCTFLILNISSLQLIPVNMIAYRQQYGSVNPAGIIGPAIMATFVSTAVAVVYCKVKDRKRRA